MADPISTASSVVALVTFGLQTTKILYNLVDTFRKHDIIVRDLKNDLSALEVVLQDLMQAMEDSNIVRELPSLKLPLYSCGQICEEFGALIRKCTQHTTNNGRSLRDWSALQLKAEQINAFRVSLSGYKSTILISIGIENLRASHVTAHCIADFKDMIEDARADLRESLERLRSPPDTSPAGVAYLDWIASGVRVQEEQNSILNCLQTCDDVSESLARHRGVLSHDLVVSPSQEHISTNQSDKDKNMSSHHLTASAINDCEATISTTRKELETRLRLVPTRSSETEEQKEERAQGCLTLCDNAMHETSRANIYEDWETGAESKQLMVSTVGDLISAKRINLGAKSVTITGQMSDQSVQAAFSALLLRDTEQKIDEPAAAAEDREPAFAKFGQGRQLT